jgi:hypothetical protein
LRAATRRRGRAAVCNNSADQDGRDFIAKAAAAINENSTHADEGAIARA